MTEVTADFPETEAVIIDASPDLIDVADRVSAVIFDYGVVVVKSFVAADDACEARSATRDYLIPSTPVRALRVAAEAVLGRDRTPEVLQRRPITLSEARWRFLGSRTATILGQVQQLNSWLFTTEPIQERYGQKPTRLNLALLNRHSPGEVFEKHQDSTASRGLSFVLQTSPTYWQIHEGGPRAGQDPFGFMTDTGDLVAQTQRSGPLDVSKLPRHTGFVDYLEDGSVVHAGVNLTRRNRYTIALFSEQAISSPSYTAGHFF